jgi:type I restriction enzyme, S subunit
MGTSLKDSPYGPVGSRFEADRLQSLCVSDQNGIQTGPFGSQLHQCDYAEHGTPIITVEHLGHNRVVHDRLPRVREEDRVRLSRYALQAGDIVFSRVGSVDRRALVRSSEIGWLFSGRCLRVRPDPSKVDPVYLSYFFGFSAFKQYVRSIAVGSTMLSLNTQLLGDVPIYHPKLSEQRAIAAILAAVDDEIHHTGGPGTCPGSSSMLDHLVSKLVTGRWTVSEGKRWLDSYMPLVRGLDRRIELSHRTNRTLDGIARALFEFWFIDHGPVRAKVAGVWKRGETLQGMPAEIWDDCSNELVDSDLGEIPGGWKVGTLGDIARNSRRAVDPSEVDPSTRYVGLEHLSPRSLALTSWGVASDVTSGKTKFLHGETLFGRLRPYLHKVSVASFDGVCSTDILAIAPSADHWSGFLPILLSSDQVVEYAVSRSNGTKMPRTSWADLASYAMALPPEALARKYSTVVGPILGQSFLNVALTRSIGGMREALMPRLFSDEARAPLKAATEEAAP